MVLTDGALRLRPWREEDATVVYEACQDPELQQWIPAIPRPYTRAHARAFVAGEAGLGPHQFAIERDGELVGSIGMTLSETADIGTVGYWCVPGRRGGGVATHALRLLSRHSFEDLRLERLQLVADPDNHASQRVAEKAGFQREGVLRSHLRHPDGRRRDSVMFSLLPGEHR
jgi:RimJ/RimL family protein N-acetyltransferase